MDVKTSLIVAMQRWIEGKECPLLDDECEPTASTLKVLMATIEMDGSLIIDMADGTRWTARLCRYRTPKWGV